MLWSAVRVGEIRCLISLIPTVWVFSQIREANFPCGNKGFSLLLVILTKAHCPLQHHVTAAGACRKLSRSQKVTFCAIAVHLHHEMHWPLKPHTPVLWSSYRSAEHKKTLFLEVWHLENTENTPSGLAPQNDWGKWGPGDWLCTLQSWANAQGQFSHFSCLPLLSTVDQRYASLFPAKVLEFNLEVLHVCVCVQPKDSWG